MKYWDTDLNTSPTKILGPVGCFLWSCQILGWKVQGPLQVATLPGLVLHLYHTPFKVWNTLAEQAWVDWVVGNAGISADFQIQHIPWASYKSLWSQRKMKDFPLALKFRTLGILSSSALAQIRNQDQATCEFCQAQDAGHYHLIFRCPHTRPLRELPRFLPCNTHRFLPDVQAYLPCQSPWIAPHAQQQTGLLWRMRTHITSSRMDQRTHLPCLISVAQAGLSLGAPTSEVILPLGLLVLPRDTSTISPVLRHTRSWRVWRQWGNATFTVATKGSFKC